MIEFLYNVITKVNQKEYDLSPEWWISHPNWNFYIRTNKRASWNPTLWLGGGGPTKEDALAMATASVINDGQMKSVAQITEDCFVIEPLTAKGIHTQDIIKNR